jgi:hypothetical protein
LFIVPNHGPDEGGLVPSASATGGPTNAAASSTLTNVAKKRPARRRRTAVSEIVVDFIPSLPTSHVRQAPPFVERSGHPSNEGTSKSRAKAAAKLPALARDEEDSAESPPKSATEPRT